MILLALVILLSGAFLPYTGDYYRAGTDAQEAMHSTDVVEVVEMDGCNYAGSTGG